MKPDLNREMSRREFIEKGVWGIAGIFSLILAVPLVGYFFDVLFKSASEQWIPVCTLDQINSLTPTEFTVAFQGENAPSQWNDVRGVFVILRGTDVLAFSNICTHMSCSVRWLDYRQQILCPCHGGVYDRWGQLAGGPPAYSLPIYPTQVQGNQVLISNRLQVRG